MSDALLDRFHPAYLELQRGLDARLMAAANLAAGHTITILEGVRRITMSVQAGTETWFWNGEPIMTVGPLQGTSESIGDKVMFRFSREVRFHSAAASLNRTSDAPMEGEHHEG